MSNVPTSQQMRSAIAVWSGFVANDPERRTAEMLWSGRTFHVHLPEEGFGYLGMGNEGYGLKLWEIRFNRPWETAISDHVDRIMQRRINR